MIPIREGWHNLTAKKPSAFFIIKINNIKTFGLFLLELPSFF